MINRITNKDKLLFLMLIIVFRLALDFSYSEVIATKFAYMGFVDNYNLANEIISVIILIIFSNVIFESYDNIDHKLSNEVLLILFLMSFVPFTSLWAFGAFSFDYIISNLIFWALLIVITKKRLIKKRYRITVGHVLEKRGIGETAIKIISLISFAIVLYISGYYTHFRFNFNLLNVYDLRAEAKSINLPTFLSYGFSWTRMINSLLLAYFMRKKRWIWAASCFVIQLLNFGIDGSKTTLILTIFVLVINLMPNFSMQQLNKWVVRAFVGVTVIGIIVYLTYDSIVPISLFVRRVLFVPADISSKYFDFFTNNTPDYFRQSFLRLFGFKSPYGTLAYMIGDVYYHQVSSANTGLIADAISNMGRLGIVIDPFLYAWVFHKLDDVSERLDARLHISVAMYAAMMLSNSFLLRVLLTHGLIVAMFILNFIDEKEFDKDTIQEV